MAIGYDDVVAALRPTGMIARGGFRPVEADEVPDTADGRRVLTVIVVGNVGGAIWGRFRAERRPVPDPLDDWTRSVLAPIAGRLGADYVHPSDEPFVPIQRWAQRADDVFESPIGLLIHPDHGLWHAYRGALLFPRTVPGLPSVGVRPSPCRSCEDMPCRTACPVDAFTTEGSLLVGYDHERCRAHVRSGDTPDCRRRGCAARRACPINADGRYGSEQMTFHMSAFAP